MKILFLIALLINIVFFLWEINSADLNSPVEKANDEKAVKQIFLVSELSRNNEVSKVSITENQKAKNVQLNFSEVYSEPGIGTQSITNQSESKANVISTILSETSGNKSSPQSFVKKDEEEQRSLEQRPNDLSVIDQTEIDLENPLINQTVVTEAVNEDNKNELTEEKSFWPDFSFIFDKSNNGLSQIEGKPHSSGFPHGTRITEVGSGYFAEALKNWSVSIFGHSIDNEDAPSLKNNIALSETQEQVNKNICYEVGPFTSIQEIEEWRKSNTINTASLKLINKNNKIALRYLVYHPAEDTFLQSKKIAREYKKKGIFEVWLFRKGDLRGAISFGLFRKEKSALRLQKKLIRSGLNVEIIERYKTRIVHYAQLLTHDETLKNKLIISDKQKINECSQESIALSTSY